MYRIGSHKTLSVAAIALMILFSGLCAAFVWGQGGSGRETPPSTNSTNKSTPRHTATPRRNPRPSRSPTGKSEDQPTTDEAKVDDAAANERTFWETIRSSNEAADFQAYLEKYPNGEFAALARIRLRRLEAEKAAAAATPTPSQPTPTQAVVAPTPTPEPVAPPPKPKPKPGDVMQNSLGMSFVLIPQGNFMMGSNEGSSDEKPVHEVGIRGELYLGRYEVTQAEWRAVMGTNLEQQRDKANPSWPLRGQGDNYPMYYVSWNEAQEFIRRLNERSDGFIYRLPSESEWEFACRAGTTGEYSASLDLIAWYANNSGQQIIDAADLLRKDPKNYVRRVIENGNQTHPVGQKQPNAFGLYDMNGNVWEWCEDWYHWTYGGAPTNGSAWLVGGEQQYRVLRGGSWDFNGTLVRSANRYWLTPDLRNNYFGFRVLAVMRPQ